MSVDHLRDVLGRAGHVLGPLEAQRRHVLLEGPHVLGGEGAEVGARLLGLLDDPVVHVGHVHDLADPVAEVAQRAAQHVGGHERPEVADVRAVVDRGPAGVEASPRAGPAGRASRPAPLSVLKSLSSWVMSPSGSVQ